MSGEPYYDALLQACRENPPNRSLIGQLLASTNDPTVRVCDDEDVGAISQGNLPRFPDALHVLCKHSADVATAELLLGHGANPGTAESYYDGWTPATCPNSPAHPLHDLCNFNYPIPIASPLMMAAGHGRLDTVKLLLRHNADPNSMDGWMHHPLSVACSRSDVDIMCDVLLQHGARFMLTHVSLDFSCCGARGICIESVTHASAHVTPACSAQHRLRNMRMLNITKPACAAATQVPASLARR